MGKALEGASWEVPDPAVIGNATLPLTTQIYFLTIHGLHDSPGIGRGPTEIIGSLSATRDNEGL